MIFNQSRNKTFRKHCKNSTNKIDRRYLYTQELTTTMNASGRKLRSGKIINKVAVSDKSVTKVDSQTENKNAVNKTVTKRRTKAQTKVVTKTLKSKSDSAKTRKVTEKDKNDSISCTKNKSNIKNRSTRRIVLSSKRKLNISESKKSVGFRQMSLKESFSNQEALSKRLRPRKDCKNYREDSSFLRRTSVSHEKENNPMVNSKSKLPVYKSVNLNESLRNVNDIYDFKFDENDSKERIIGKRKKRIVKRAPQKKTKKTNNVIKKKPKVMRVVLENLSSDAIALIKEKTKADVEKKNMPSSTDIAKKSDDDNNKENKLMSFNGTNNLEVESDNVQHLEMDEESSTKDIVKDNQKTSDIKSSKPKVISIQNINNTEISLEITPLKLKPNKFVPFRKTNIFDNKAKYNIDNTIKDSSINKSLSPIKKMTTNFDAGSPWRLSSLNSFSQMKNLFQSTPLPRTLQILEAKTKRNKKDQDNKCLETSKINNVPEMINEDVNTHKMFEKFSNVNGKVGLVARKFGTEITNLDNSTPINNENVVNEKYEEIESNKELRLANKDLQNTTGITSMDPPVFNITIVDKENAVPISPSKSPSKSKNLIRKRLRKTTNINFSPKRKRNRIENKENSNTQLQLDSTLKLNRSDSLLHSSDKNQEESKDILEPQPGPSGLQSFKSPNHKPLQQTNLNAFLNVMDMPQSTRITTTHGIFNDAQSTPINKNFFKPIKAVNTKGMELENAFGFNDVSDTVLDISPIYPQSEQNVEENVEDKKIMKTNVEDNEIVKTKINVQEVKRPSALPVRILSKEVKKTIMSEKVDVDKKDKKETENKNVIAEESLSKTKNTAIDVISFSDTFDILEEAKEVQNKSLDVPLFTDFPTHFTEPPRRSYKRKRNVRFDFDENDSEEEENDNQLMERKRKKNGKLKTTEIKRMEEWVQSINETFQEIDHYELVVE